MSIANPPAMKESQLQRTVIECAKLLGWRVMHQRPARTSEGWRTAIEGHAGFPDLVLLRPPRLIFAELKSVKGALTHDQGIWLNGLKAAGVESYVWRPVAWEQGLIEDLLR